MKNKTSLKEIKNLLKDIFEDIQNRTKNNLDEIIKKWPSIIGSQLSPMTKIISFNKNVLKISVNNSTLYGLLSQYEKQRLLNILKKEFPKYNIKTIRFIHS